VIARDITTWSKVVKAGNISFNCRTRSRPVRQCRTPAARGSFDRAVEIQPTDYWKESN